MIVDLSRRGDHKMFITQRVDGISQSGEMYHVSFSGQAQPYTYRCERLLFLSHPEKVDLEGRGLYIRKKHITDAAEVYRFGQGSETFWHIIYQNGYCIDVDGREVYLSRTTISQADSNLWEYLHHVVTETGLELKPRDNDDTLNLLLLQYNLVDVTRDNVPLASYLDARQKTTVSPLPAHIIYPFGCNASQKTAVERALTSQVSIIQGPPGTGKTQTILNIIANLMIRGKSVLVVSNNNSAVENVEEKLSSPDIGLGFLVAKLGNVENRTLFIKNQSSYPDMSDWIKPGMYALAQNIDHTLAAVSESFDQQVALARLRTERSALETEKKYNEALTLKHGYSWLEKISSATLMRLLCQLQQTEGGNGTMGIVSRLKWTFTLGLKAWPLLRKSITDNVPLIEAAYYSSRRREIDQQMDAIESYLGSHQSHRYADTLRQLSLKFLKSAIATQYKGRTRTLFYRNTIKQHSDEFLQEYPIVLSTTYSAKSCISKDMVFDYVIMDEASQVDIATGALALSCAENAVIVGDDKQLPNVIEGRTMQVLRDIETAHGIDDKYRMTTHSFLKSCTEVFSDAPSTLLREHYRCSPKIIEFCNKMFYDNELQIMTKDRDNEKTLGAMLTAPGNHARGHINQREIDVISQEIMPLQPDNQSVGIITPYRDQAFAINRQLHRDIASTVHKFQGRECDAIIMSMVDNEPTSFSDDANLLNVAISRAKSELCIVATGNQIPGDSILGQLIGYIRYNNFQVEDSSLHSVFDLLYKEYTEQRLKFQSKLKDHQGELSENLIFNTLTEALAECETRNVKILVHYPLSRLIASQEGLSEEQRNFINSTLSHVDFLLYNDITKQPLLCIEVDGWQYHHTEVQKHRDLLKDAILAHDGLKLVRLSTTSIVTKETLRAIIKSSLNMSSGRK